MKTRTYVVWLAGWDINAIFWSEILMTRDNLEGLAIDGWHRNIEAHSEINLHCSNCTGTEHSCSRNGVLNHPEGQLLLKVKPDSRYSVFVEQEDCWAFESGWSHPSAPPVSPQLYQQFSPSECVIEHPLKLTTEMSSLIPSTHMRQQ